MTTVRLAILAALLLVGCDYSTPRWVLWDRVGGYWVAISEFGTLDQCRTARGFLLRKDGSPEPRCLPIAVQPQN